MGVAVPPLPRLGRTMAGMPVLGVARPPGVRGVETSERRLSSARASHHASESGRSEIVYRPGPRSLALRTAGSTSQRSSAVVTAVSFAVSEFR